MVKPTKSSARSSGRERLIEAGIKAFGAQQYDDVSMAQVAREAGVAEGLPFHHFGSKRGFYVEVARRVCDEYTASCRPRPGKTPGDVIRDIIRRGIIGWRSFPLIPMTTRGGPGGDNQVRDIIVRSHRVICGDILGVLGESRPTKTLELAVLGWLGLADEIIAEWLVDGRGITQKRIVGLIVASLAGVVDAAAALDATIEIDTSSLRIKRVV